MRFPFRLAWNSTASYVGLLAASFGLALFIIGSIGCAAAPSIAWLIFFRFIQGIGASSVMVIPRAIIRDLFTRDRAASMIGLVATVMVVAPMVAPLIGGIIWIVKVQGALNRRWEASGAI